MSETISDRMQPATIDDVRDVLRRRFLTVVADLPLSQPLQASARIALREVSQNVRPFLLSDDDL